MFSNLKEQIRIHLEGNKPAIFTYLVIAGITLGLAAISIATGHSVTASRGH